MKALIIQGSFPGGKPHTSVLLQAKMGGRHTGSSIAYQIDSRRLNLASPGQPLPDGVLQKMESVFKTNFFNVRIHTGREAESIGALAFTSGNDIYFATGQYNPNSPHGQRLLGHELTHVVQQKSGRVKNPFGNGVAVVNDPGLEAEAERMGRKTITVSEKKHDGDDLIIQRAKKSNFSFTGSVVKLWDEKSESIPIISIPPLMTPSTSVEGLIPIFDIRQTGGIDLQQMMSTTPTLSSLPISILSPEPVKRGEIRIHGLPFHTYLRTQIEETERRIKEQRFAKLIRRREREYKGLDKTYKTFRMKLEAVDREVDLIASLAGKSSKIKVDPELQKIRLEKVRQLLDLRRELRTQIESYNYRCRLEDEKILVRKPKESFHRYFPSDDPVGAILHRRIQKIQYFIKEFIKLGAALKKLVPPDLVPEHRDKRAPIIIANRDMRKRTVELILVDFIPGNAGQVASKIVNRTTEGNTGFTVNGRSVYHSSRGSGAGGRVGTAFWFVHNGGVVIIAIGHHVTSDTYQITWLATGARVRSSGSSKRVTLNTTTDCLHGAVKLT